MEKINREERKDSNLFLGIQNLEVENVKDDPYMLWKWRKSAEKSARIQTFF